MLHQNLLFVPRRVCVCVWIMSLLVFACPLPIKAAKTSVSQLVLGKVVSIGGQRFIKIANDPVKGSQFMAMESVTSDDGGGPPPDPPDRVCTPNQFNGMAMQEFSASDCDCLPTPVATGYTAAGTLIDERDGKSYEVRKFADGKCWMADNLMYGGEVDNCAGVGEVGFTDPAYGGVYGMAAPSNRFGVGTYGNCQDPRVDGVAPCTTNSTTCGYLYNYQAVIQSAEAYERYSYKPDQPTQGICPDGWHVPSDNGLSNEFVVLDTANGGSGESRYYCSDDACSFFWPDHAFKGVYAGDSAYGQLSDQASTGYWWSNDYEYPLAVSDSYFSFDYPSGGGKSVRCISTACEANYLLANATCVPAGTAVPNCVASDGNQCTACVDEYSVVYGACVKSCAVFDGDVCTACEEGYVLDGETCVPTGSVSSCAVYSAPEVCVRCSFGCSLAHYESYTFCACAD